MQEAIRCREEGKHETIVFGLTGTGYFDMLAYGKYNAGEMNDYVPTDEEISASLQQLA